MLRSGIGTRQARPSSVLGWARERVFDALYGPGARIYDRFTHWLFLGEWEAWQRTALADIPESSLVVELGSGTGALASWGASAERRWLGCDVSPAMLQMARTRTAPNGPWFVRANAGRLPIADGAADAVVATFPTRYLLAPRTTAEAARILRPEGRLIVVVSGSLTPDGLGRGARRVALNLFYGIGRSPTTAFGVDGFAGATVQRITPHGVAAVYVGTPLR